jgi:hypothetical protein
LPWFVGRPPQIIKFIPPGKSGCLVMTASALLNLWQISEFKRLDSGAVSNPIPAVQKLRFFVYLPSANPAIVKKLSDSKRQLT